MCRLPADGLPMTPRGSLPNPASRSLRIALLAALAALTANCSALEGGADGKAAKGGPGEGGPPPSVVVAPVERVMMADRIEAVGTARANEQADLNSTVTERIARINFRDGQYVPRGAVIAELVRSEQGATLTESQARLREAEAQLARLKQLQQQGFATRARIDEQQAAVDVARAQGSAARSQIGDRVIRAPFSGWLSLRRISPGSVVTAGTPIVTIVDHSRIKLDFSVPETYLATLKPGLAVSARTIAFPGEEFRGTVDSIDPVLDPVTRSATARAILPNPDLRLRPGMLMTVELAQRPRPALTVPELAVIGEGSGSHVWRVLDGNRVERATVQTGGRREGRIEIVSGLSEGQMVVAEGTVKLRGPGPIRPVTVAEAARGTAAPPAGRPDAAPAAAAAG